MENDLTPNEAHLFQLIDEKDYDQLTPEERLFVDEQLSEADYKLQRRMIMEAPELFSVPTVNTLLLPVDSSKGFVRRTVPLYQAIAAVAATIALFLSLWPSQDSNSTNSNDGIQLGHIDTVIQTRMITDTVIEYIEQRNRHTSLKHKTQHEVAADQVIQVKQLRLLETGAIQLPELNAALLHTKGSSLKEDPRLHSLLGNVYQATNW